MVINKDILLLMKGDIRDDTLYFRSNIYLLGGFMCIMPQKAVKKELQNSEEEIKRAKRNGIIILVAGIVFIVVNILL